jgi:FkbH-like protein
VLNLHDRGVILALCSKNNEADVMEILRSHPEMLLREDHLAAWQINWDDKATNLARIAETLNIGLDSLVFVDDSPFECELVRARLPEVAVVELSSDPSSFPARLSEGAYFDTLTLSAEDRVRNRMYRDEGLRKQLLQTASSLAEYLERLEMVAEIGLADCLAIARVAQLTQKTNQFNLTTLRYSEGEIRALVESADADVFTLKLRDRVADLGLIGVAIVRYRGTEAVIDTFLISCRAIGRGAEEALLAHVVNTARARGCAIVTGRYTVSPRNGQVAEFYGKQGFCLASQDRSSSEWKLSTEQSRCCAPAWIKVDLKECRA